MGSPQAGYVVIPLAMAAARRSAIDPMVMAAAGAVFLLTTSMAVVLPAYRAATMDPLVALRQD